MKVLNENERVFEAWGSVECIDKDGEIIPIEELEKTMPILMDRGGYIIDQHSNRVVGKILNYEIKTHPKTKKKGVYIVGKIFNHYDLDDKVWQEIKEGKRKGLSFGGSSKKQEVKFSFDSEKPVKVLRDIEGYEFSVVESPANPFAIFEWVNPIAKGYKEPKRLRDMIAEAVYGKKFDELNDEEKQKIHTIATKIREVGKMVEDVKKPFAAWDSFDDCVKDMMRKQGYDEETARKVCGKIYWQTEGKKKDAQEDNKNDGGVEKMEEKKKQEETAVNVEELANRVAALEAKVQELEQKLAPAEEVTEEAKEENKEETTKEGEIGTKPVNPPKEGGNVTLPKDVTEKPQPDEEKDKVKIMEKMQEIEKKLETITKGLKIETATTPKPDVETSEKEEMTAMDIIKAAREGKRVTMEDMANMEREKIRKLYEGIVR